MAKPLKSEPAFAFLIFDANFLSTLKKLKEGASLVCPIPAEPEKSSKNRVVNFFKGKLLNCL